MQRLYEGELGFLIANNYRISPKLYDMAIRNANEAGHLYG